jgi:hypothetical protein
MLLAMIVFSHALAGLTLFCMNLSPPLTALFGALVAVSAWRAKRGQDHKRGMALRLRVDGGISLVHAENIEARVLPDAVLFPGILWFTLAWTAPDSRHRSLRLMVLKSEVDEEGWRVLRVWLRHCVPRAVGVDGETG